MIDYSDYTRQRIVELAYQKWQYRKDFGIFVTLDRGELRPITAQDDWMEAEAEILDEYRCH